MLRFHLLHVCAIILLAVSALLVAAAGCFHRGRTAPGPPAAQVRQAPVASTYVGNDACKECHQKEFAAHAESAHARTLAVGTRNGMGRLSPPIGEIPGTRYAVKAKGEGFELGVPGKPAITRAIDLVIGSGKFGVSYMTVHANGMERLRMSYLPTLGKWYKHPGDEDLALYDPPIKFDLHQSRNCLRCHSVSQPASAFMPQNRFFGVGCESCHGPGSAHIEAARTKSTGRQRDLHMEKLSALGATRIIEMCGRCHSKSGDSTETVTSPEDTVRFAANALMQSRCFWQSADVFSCLTCHDSHTDVSKDPNHYNGACLKCHGPGPGKPADGYPCPVNPKDKCTSCHMKPGKFRPGTDIPTKMTEHYIRPPAALRAGG